MKRFVEGQDRTQGVLLPEFLDDYVAEDNPVRVIDVFVDELDLRALGFEGVAPESTGRPAYHPITLLKIYVYGYINQIQSSRRLERETARNVEMMWLTGRLAPDFKTIADFSQGQRRGDPLRLPAVCRALPQPEPVQPRDRRDRRQPVQGMQLPRPVLLARLDQAPHGRSRRASSAICRRSRRRTARQGEAAEAKSAQLKDKIASLREQMGKLKALEVAVHAAPDKQISLTDPDARSMATSGKDTGLVGYNVQAVVDTQHHLIVAHEVTNIGNDRSQLATMAKHAQEATGVRELTAIADRGYFKGEEILACEAVGVTPLVPKPLTSTAKADGRFGKQDFVYDAGEDVYLCPAGEKMTFRYSNVEAGRKLHNYWTTKCTTCALKPKCTPAKERRIKRWEHEAVLEAMQERLERAPMTMRIRRQTAEHPFGTIKAWMGATHFRLRTLEKVGTEMSLHVLAYNLKRMIAILGVQPLIQAMRAA
jgi:transposase